MNYLSGSFDVRGYGFTRARALPRGKQTKQVSIEIADTIRFCLVQKYMEEAGSLDLRLRLGRAQRRSTSRSARASTTLEFSVGVFWGDSELLLGKGI